MLLLSALVLPAAPGRPAVDDASFRSIVLAAHDRERREVGSPPLAWDDSLAADAAAWADRLARTRTFEHCSEAGCPTGDQGENLWMGTKGAYRLERMLEGWSEEKRLLARMSSWEDDYHAVGHYTQMVWHSTRRVGCAVRSNRSDEFLVCRYMEAGNVMGESPYAAAGTARRGGASRPRPSDVARTDAEGVPYVDGGEEDPADGAIDEGYRDGPDGTTVVTSTSPEGITTVVTTTTTTVPR